MVDINLLPWRAYARARRQKNKKIGFFIGSGLLIVFLFILYNRFYLAPRKIQVVPKIPSIASAPPFQLTGFLHQENQSWALVLLPNGQVKEVRVGDVIANHWRLISVDENKMVVENGLQKRTIAYPT